MDIFRSTKRVRLSPRLARTIGRPEMDEKLFAAKVVFVSILAFVLFFVISGSHQNNVLIKNASDAESREVEGHVLGANTNNIASYTVQPGDTLIEVSQKFQVYWMTIVSENELKSPYALRPGQILRIPLPRNK
ncbi:MAG: hypothetical protein A3J48_02285 [Candidatus Doudnabacteria bacterium RIFCSPHIGHO2_02_FULL_46_11]|uniref:LysM domain-containing protein n=1 Tax=Candidatus Doudnabacteria bacterium RIFCSPHIGHO2_02_FULL_46_11 TaxID=1817832 RepID=A0A1F5P885_9BACT|nr:MAG: hypothetical protein A3J48_02285 [Candidatus Doudnabacteria bacterium RIFCSPHIGHO2_02_FULL_46_11]